LEVAVGVKTTAALAGAAVLLTWAGGASSARAGAESASAPAGCDLPLGDADADEVDGRLVVMLDGTTSSADETDRIDDLVTLIDAATDEQTLSLSLASFGGSDDEVRYSRCFDGTTFVPDGNNARTRERNRPALVTALRDEITSLDGGYEATDPTSALRAGTRRLDGVEGERLLVIHTDGIPTAGCASLPDEVAVDDPDLVAQLTQACVDDGQIPSADGVEIVVGGIGRTDRDLDSAAVTFLIELNTALCEASGATCHVDPNLPADL
jgi:hypothetical protein